MPDEVLDYWLSLLQEATHIVTVERLNARAAEGAPRRLENTALGLCEVHLWRFPRRIALRQDRPAESWIATRQQAERLISGGASDDRDEGGCGNERAGERAELERASERPY